MISKNNEVDLAQHDVIQLINLPNPIMMLALRGG